MDISKQTEKLCGDEKTFYEDQNTCRIARLNEEIDTQYEEEKAQAFLVQYEHDQMNAAEYEVSMATSSEEEDDEELCEVPGTFQSLNRYGLARSTLTMQSISTQTNHEHIAKPKLRKNLKVCTDEIKATCAYLSSMSGISVETSRRAVQIVCKHLYNNEFHLSNPKGVDDDSANDATQDHEPPTKKSRLPSTVQNMRTIYSSFLRPEQSLITSRCIC